MIIDVYEIVYIMVSCLCGVLYIGWIRDLVWCEWEY